MTAHDRAAEMLRIAAQYIREADHEDYTIFYDDAVCDRWCIADDCEGAAEAIAALTDPAPAKQVTVSEAEAIREAATVVECEIEQAKQLMSMDIACFHILALIQKGDTDA